MTTMNSEPIAPTARNSRPLCRKVMSGAASVLRWIVLLGMIGWSGLAIYYSNLPGWLRPVVAVIFVLAALGVLIFVRPRWRGRLVFGVMFAVLVALWFMIPPSNKRNWQPDVALLPSAEIKGNKVALHNIRLCEYRGETDYDVYHYDRTFDLDKLNTVDFYVVYWGSPAICHTMLSFGFGDEGYVCISIETRKEKGESYSAIKGFFRQFELTYVVADERDLVRLRTNFRDEQVYLYRLNTPPEVTRKVFLDYLEEINHLKKKPEWYNALTSNCTSNIRGHTKPYAARSPWSWKLIINGYLDEMVYDNGSVDRSLPFPEFKKRSFINDRAKAADKDPDFSKRIREGLPGIKP